MGTKSIYRMSDMELRQYKRELRIRKARRQRVAVFGIMAFVTITLILIFFVCCGSFKSNANSGYKYYDSVTVKSGDTLWTIADTYIDYDHYKNKQSFIDEVRTINHLDYDGTIISGQILVVPYYMQEYVY